MHQDTRDVERFIVERLRPRVRVDGGEIVVESVAPGTVRLGAHRECAKCPASDQGLRWWIEKELNGAFEGAWSVQITRRPEYYH